MEKMKRNHNKDLLFKLNMVTNLRMIRHMQLLDAFLKRVDIVKELFIQEIEQGKECIIPKDLSQDKLPISFRYYDPVISLV